MVIFLKDNDDEQISVGDLVEKMEEYLNDSATVAYSRTHMKARLQEHLGDQIIIAEINGKPNVVTFRSSVAAIFQEFHAQHKVVDLETEKLSITRAASRLIKNDIKLRETSNEIYPLIETDPEKNANLLQATLKVCLENILVGKDNVKLASIGQAILQAARPGVNLMPLQVGLAVQLHHNFASRFLIDTLLCQGFCSSYQEVQLFNQNAALDQGTDIPDYDREFVQYGGDNVDHNVRTLDDKDTFHGMGMICTTTTGTKRKRYVPRKKISPQDISAAGKVELHPPSEPRQSQVQPQQRSGCESGRSHSDFRGNHKGKSSITFLSMIGMNPSEVTCISSTLKFMSEHAQRHNIVNPIVTFDQPLWCKAFNIIRTEPVNSELRSDFAIWSLPHENELPREHWPPHGGIRVTRTFGADICVKRH